MNASSIGSFSPSFQRKRDRGEGSYRRSRTLARGGDVHLYAPSDFRYVWAAYRQGAFAATDLFEDGATVEAVRDAMEILTSAPRARWYILTAPHKEKEMGTIPMALVAGDHTRQERENDDGSTRVRELYEPHVVWFPWASARNKIECGVRFFETLRRRVCVVVYALPSEHEYFVTMCRYGLMRRVGSIEGYFGFDRDEAQVWQTRVKGARS